MMDDMVTLAEDYRAGSAATEARPTSAGFAARALAAGGGRPATTTGR